MHFAHHDQQSRQKWQIRGLPGSVTRLRIHCQVLTGNKATASRLAVRLLVQLNQAGTRRKRRFQVNKTSSHSFAKMRSAAVQTTRRVVQVK